MRRAIKLTDNPSLEQAATRPGDVNTTFWTMRNFPASTYARLTLLCVVVEAIVVITLAAVVTALFLRNTDLVADTPANGTPVYLIVFCVSQLYQAVISTDAIWSRNTVQITGFVAFNAVLFFYSLFQYFHVTALLDDPLLSVDVTDEGALNSIRPALYVIPIIVGVFQVLYIFFAYKLYQEFSWKIYKKIGPEPKMTNMYRWYQVVVALLKFDVFFGLAFAVQYVILQLTINEPEFWATVIAMPISLVIVLLGIYGIRKEDRIVTASFVAGILCAIAYFIFKIVRMFDATEHSKYEFTWKYLVFFASITLFALAGTLATTIVCYVNFDKGLARLVSGVAETQAKDFQGPSNGLQRALTNSMRAPLDA